MSLRDDIRHRLEAQMAYQGMTQAELARRSGLTPKHINQLMSGKTFTSPEMLDYLAFLLGCHWRIALIDPMIQPNGGADQ